MLPSNVDKLIFSSEIFSLGYEPYDSNWENIFWDEKTRKMYVYNVMKLHAGSIAARDNTPQ